MKPSLRLLRSFAQAALLLAFIAALPVLGQDARLQIDHLDRLEAKSIESVEVTLDELRLRAVHKLLTLDTTDRSRLREILAKLKGIYIRGFEFANDGEYREADLDLLRTQLNAPGWQRIVEVRERDGSRDEVYLMPRGDVAVGFASISAEPRKLCIINIVGPLQLEEMNLLEKQFEFKRCGIGSKKRR